MKLSEMQQIADKVKDKHFTVGQRLTAEEWEFATMATANFDKLLVVVEAARRVLLPHDCDCEICIALKELDGEK